VKDLIVPVVTLLLGSGGALFVQNLFKGLTTLRGGARAREREAVNDLARARDAADNRAEWAEADRDFWRDVAGRWRYQLVSHNVEPNPSEPEPPSARRAKTKP
jgi:hypothetical protein